MSAQIIDLAAERARRELAAQSRGMLVLALLLLFALSLVGDE